MVVERREEADDHIRATYWVYIPVVLISFVNIL
jgi:hypothetical protein